MPLTGNPLLAWLTKPGGIASATVVSKHYLFAWIYREPRQLAVPADAPTQP